VGRSKGGGYVEGPFHGGIFLKESKFSMKGVPDFPALFKKQTEIKLKKNKFFQLKVRSNI